MLDIDNLRYRKYPLKIILINLVNSVIILVRINAETVRKSR